MLATKEEFRRRVRANANSDSTLANAAAKQIAARLAQDACFLNARTVALFASLPDEIPTAPIHDLCRGQDKTVVYPLIRSRTVALDFYPVKSLSADEATLHRGPFGINQPKVHAGATPVQQIDLFLIPGLAFSLSGTRLGRGNGYYDRTLAKVDFSQVTRYGIAFDSQIFEALPEDSFDVPVHKVFTPEREIECNRSGRHKERE